VALACVFSFAGLLFLVMKSWLYNWLTRDQQHDMCVGIIAQAEKAQDARLQAQQLAALQQHVLEHRADIIDQMVRDDWERDLQAAQRRHDASVKALVGIPTTLSQRRVAESGRLASEREIASLEQQRRYLLAPCLLLGAALLGLSSGCTRADLAQQLETQAPTMQILADCSTSSPVYQSTFVESAMRTVITPKLMALPMASRVIVTCIGDSAQTPLSYDARVQAVNNGNGGTKAKLVQEMERLLKSVPSNTKYNRSELIFGFAEAAKKINPGASHPNQIIALSDLIEESAFANCSPKAKAFCKLPAPTFKLKNTELVVLGVAVGMDGKRALVLNETWQGFFVKAGLDPQHLALRRD
jgi:hypothetical protein